MAAPWAADFAIVVYSDIACPWAHIATYRLERSRRQRGIDRELTIDHRCFPIELFEGRPTPRHLAEVEVPVCSRLEPDAGWSTDPDPWSYPVSTLPALEAVQVAKRQSPEVAVALDLALRRAVFAEWRCVSVFGEIFDVATQVEGLDTDTLWADLREGWGRRELFGQYDEAHSQAISASPTFVLPDRSVIHNPGIEMHWDDDRLVIDEDDPAVYDDLIDRALVARPSD